ncbi:MAG: response regulator [Candidatus Nitrosotenuis sp.]|nr:response regulator [Candidatus Nitrosotenuis sp.]
MYNVPTAIVVDDDHDTVDLFCEYLSIINIKVLGRGHNGLEAVELYEKYKPDIVFLDLLMPDYDGLFGLENIREINPDAYIVFITAVVDKGRKDKIENLRPNHIIHKPFDPDQFVQIVSEVNAIKSGQKAQLH